MRKKKVAIGIFKDKEKILVQDRKPWDEFGFDYGFFGGKLNPGESAEQAFKREIKEELGIEIKNYKFIKHTFRKISELNVEIEYYIYNAPIPKLKEIDCKEGRPFLTTLRNALTLNFNPADMEVLKEVLECK
jgi:mutator protein MutT